MERRAKKGIIKKVKQVTINNNEEINKERKTGGKGKQNNQTKAKQVKGREKK